MNKKFIAVAVVGAVVAPAVAFAQAGNVQIYGRANLGLDNYSATGSTAGAAGDLKSRNRIYDVGSRLGFRGAEDLGNGLKAVFLMESGVNVDSGGTTGQGGAVNVHTGTLSSRMGYVGLDGRWGSLRFGKQNVFWINGWIEPIGSTYVYTAVPSFTGGLGRGMSVGVNRVSNTMQYNSPKVGGINATVSYSPTGEAQPAAANTDGKLWGVSLLGTWGAFGARYDWVKNRANSPTIGSQAATTGQKVGVGWAYQPGARISLLWLKSVKENMGATTADAAATRLSQTAWGLSWEHLLGNVQALAQWGKTANVSGCVTAGACNDTNATAWQLGVRYVMSKRTAAYLTYNTVKNNSRYNMDYIAGGVTSAGSGLGVGSVGADPRIVGVGIMHNF